MKITRYYLKGELNLKVALLCDFHNGNPYRCITALEKEKPDLIFIAGDVVDRLSLSSSQNALRLLKGCVSISPTFFSFGNHEIYLLKEDVNLIKSLGITVLDNSFVIRGKTVIGGFSSIYYNRNEFDVKSFQSQNGYKILLCHHPEYYPKYLKKSSINLILSGHAHGGQIRLFNKGLYAPGQGIFPKYTKGIYDEKLIVSAGLSAKPPLRLFNPTELVIINI